MTSIAETMQVVIHLFLKPFQADETFQKKYNVSKQEGLDGLKSLT